MTLAEHSGAAPESWSMCVPYQGDKASMKLNIMLQLARFSFALPGVVGGVVRSAFHCGPVYSGFLSATPQIDVDRKYTGPLQAALHWTFYR